MRIAAYSPLESEYQSTVHLLSLGQPSRNPQTYGICMAIFKAWAHEGHFFLLELIWNPSALGLLAEECGDEMMILSGRACAMRKCQSVAEFSGTP
jgi:hypothetical protein